jgi:hypothetical protein
VYTVTVGHSWMLKSRFFINFRRIVSKDSDFNSDVQSTFGKVRVLDSLIKMLICLSIYKKLEIANNILYDEIIIEDQTAVLFL